MAVTLAQAALNTQDDLDANIIDEFRKQSAILDALVFHDAVSAMGGGSTLTYGYHRVTSERAAAFREVNNEYTANQAEKGRFTVDLKPLGGSFEIDRVLAQIARGTETSFQLQQLIKATRAKFTDELVNGDTAVDSKGFDGLNKALRGTTTELNEDSSKDWSDLDTYGFHKALDDIDELFGVLDGVPSIAIGNSRLVAKIRAIARRANQYVEAPVDGLTDEFGNPVMRQMLGNTMLVDAGEKAGSTSSIVPISTRDVDGTTYTTTVTGSPTGGTYTLNITIDGVAEETDAVAHNASAATVQAAILANDNVPAGAVTVTGTSTLTISFVGALTDVVVTVALGTNSLTGGSTPSVTVTESATTANVTGLTDLYVVRIGMDGFHGVSVAGQPILQTWLPDFTTAGAVKKGEVEMGPVACVLKATKAAGVLRNIKVS
jgi:hypothetical protein